MKTHLVLTSVLTAALALTVPQRRTENTLQARAGAVENPSKRGLENSIAQRGLEKRVVFFTGIYEISKHGTIEMPNEPGSPRVGPPPKVELVPGVTGVGHHTDNVMEFHDSNYKNVVKEAPTYILLMPDDKFVPITKDESVHSSLTYAENSDTKKSLEEFYKKYPNLKPRMYTDGNEEILDSKKRQEALREITGKAWELGTTQISDSAWTSNLISKISAESFRGVFMLRISKESTEFIEISQGPAADVNAKDLKPKTSIVRRMDSSVPSVDNRLSRRSPDTASNANLVGTVTTPQTTLEKQKSQYQKFLSAFEAAQAKAIAIINPFLSEMLADAEDNRMMYDAAWSIYAELTFAPVQIIGPFTQGLTSQAWTEEQLFKSGDSLEALLKKETLSKEEREKLQVVAIGRRLELAYVKCWTGALAALRKEGVMQDMLTLTGKMVPSNTDIMPERLMQKIDDPNTPFFVKMGKPNN